MAYWHCHYIRGNPQLNPFFSSNITITLSTLLIESINPRPMEVTEEEELKFEWFTCPGLIKDALSVITVPVLLLLLLLLFPLPLSSVSWWGFKSSKVRYSRSSSGTCKSRSYGRSWRMKLRLAIFSLNYFTAEHIMVSFHFFGSSLRRITNRRCIEEHHNHFYWRLDCD